MVITRHPSEATLLRHAAGTLDEGPALVVATHLGFCPGCRAWLQRFEALGGDMLDREPGTAMAPNASSRTLSRLDQPEAPPISGKSPAIRAAMPVGFELPLPLRHYDIGRWRPMAPGLRFSRIGISRRQGTKVMLLRGTPGAAMPAHGHDEIEFTCVLTGAFVDKTGRYGPGDMAEASAALDHQPIIEPGDDCISLVAIEGSLKLHSFLGRLVSPLLGF